MIFPLVLLVALAATDAARLPYIIGGKVAEKGAWPWQISFQVQNGDGYSHTCGGSLLNERWVLLASHCVMFNQKPESYMVKLGLYQLSADDYVQAITIDQIIMHPEFNLNNPGLPHDIALIHLTEDADLSSSLVSTVELASEDIKYAGQSNCYITGWGRDDRSSQLPSDLLREYNTIVLTNPVCEKKYGWWNKMMPLSEYHICVNDPDVADVHACHGDSGGPLSCKVGEGPWQVVGVASRTGPIDCENYPSVYIRTSKYLTWINDIISQ